MDTMKRTIEFLLALALGLAWTTMAQAEQADRNKPINLEADSVRVDDTRQLSIYEGHVVLTQGTLMITADRIEMRQDENKGVSGVALGKPVYFRQKMDASEEFAEGWANQLEYDGRGDKIHLLGKARLKRGIDELRGEQISYDSVTTFFQAKGASAGAPSGRVRAVIRPRNTAPASTQPVAKP